MGIAVKSWRIVRGKLEGIETGLKDAGRTEPGDLEPWLASNPGIIGPDLLVIGRQVMTSSGPIDLLGVDRLGRAVIIEIKRGSHKFHLLQALSYAAMVSKWPQDRILTEYCSLVGKAADEGTDDI